MKDDDIERGAGPQEPQANGRGRGISRKARLGLGAAILLGMGAIGGALATVAGSSWAHGGFGRMGGPADEGVMMHRAGAKLERLMDVVDATDEQKARAKPIVDELITEVFPLVEQHKEHRRALVGVLVGGEMSRAAIETIRTAEIDLLDQATSALADAAVEIGAVLTDEQRAKLARLARSHRRDG